MNKIQLKKLIKEVLREVESEVGDPKTNTGSGKPEDTTMKHSIGHEKEYGQMRDTFLKLKLGGINKNNSHIIRDFIAQAAHAAKMADLEVIHAELEKAGKIGLTVDEPEIKKSEAEINAELDAMAAGMGGEDVETATGQKMPSPEAWKKMSPEERSKYIKQGSHAAEWDAATEKDAEDTRAKSEKARLKAAKIKAGTYDPNDQSLWTDAEKASGKSDPTALWTDKDWDAWDQKQDKAQTYTTGKSAGKYKPNLSKKTAQGIRGAVRGDFSDTLRHE